MSKIKVFETFAGIGAQHKAITNIKKGFKVIGTSEWDARAIISYSLIHHKKKFERKLKEVKTWTNEEIEKYLSKKTFSLDSKKPSKLKGKNRIFKENLISANIVNNNFPDINKLEGKNLKDVDLLTYSFPCQGLSIANMGRAKGIKKDVDSTSNLIWQIKRILDEIKKNKNKLPKYLLLENVKTLVGTTHKKDFEIWDKYLKKLGYKTFWSITNSKDHNAITKRKRLFALSIKGKTKIFKSKKDFELQLEKFQKIIPNFERKKKYFKILNSSTEEEIINSIPNKTKSRIRMSKENIDLEKDAKKYEYYFKTLTTKQDRHPNIGMIKVSKKILNKAIKKFNKDKLEKRFLTPKETFQIMGFKLKDFKNLNSKIKENILNKESLYRQSGNSIVVSNLESIFKLILEIEKKDFKNE